MTRIMNRVSHKTLELAVILAMLFMMCLFIISIDNTTAPSAIQLQPAANVETVLLPQFVVNR